MRLPSQLSRAQTETLVFAAIVTLVPIVLCGFMFGFDIPLASAKFWSNPKNDMLAMTTAYEAYVRQPWGFPLTMVSGLTPKPVSIVFADSIPWLSLALKASGLGALFNPLGVFLMLSYPLQAWGMIALLRSLGVKSRVALVLGGFLALLFPSWIARQFGHIALCGHWLILLALSVTVSSVREGLTPRRIGWFAALATLATGVHAYHLPPIAACFGAALLSELLQRRAGAWMRVPVAAVAVLAAVGISAVVLGYGGGASAAAGAGGLGYYAMNLLGPVWPQASNLFGQQWTGAWFKGTLAPNGEYFEGFQFLGVGSLLLVATMLGLAIRDRLAGRRPEPGFWLRWTPLILAMLVLTAWSIGWSVYAGKALLVTLPKPDGKVADLLSIFRAHGRFFWAPGYLVLALAITAVARQPRRVGVAVLAAALAVQAYDSSPLRQGVRSTFSAPDELDIPPGLAGAPAIRGRHWTFRPTYFCSNASLDLRGVAQLVMAAARSGGTTNTFGTARNNDLPCDVIDPTVSQDAAPGDRRITVIMGGGQMEGGVLAIVNQRHDCYRFKRGVLCGRDLGGIAGLDPIEPGQLGAKVQLLSVRLDQPLKSPVLGEGWSQLDPGGKGIWTLAHKATFTLTPPATLKPGAFNVDIVAIGFSDQPLRPQPVTLYAEGRRLETQAVDPKDFILYRFTVPKDVVKPGQPIRFTLDIPEARVSSLDPRMLGVAVQEIRLAQ